jgi:hypothetical protein
MVKIMLDLMEYYINNSKKCGDKLPSWRIFKRCREIDVERWDLRAVFRGEMGDGKRKFSMDGGH